jgi:uncharacterized protein YndB with AHSA1/START domain
MTTVTRHTPAPPEAVWAVLADGTRYADWVVGAKRIRAVDEAWPAPGSRFHHAVGVGPVDIRDSSVSDAVEPGRMLSLRVRAFPAGAARVRIVLRETDDGGTDIVMEEHPIEGIARRLDSPLLRGALSIRNRESLRRLGRLAERATTVTGGRAA